MVYVITKQTKKSSMLSFLLFSLFIVNVESACGKGCIGCDTAKDECYMCDPFTKYQLDKEGNCSQVTLADCEVLDPSQGSLNCLQCKSGLVFDSNTSKCADVPSNLKVLECQDYNQSGGCVTCNSKHYIDNGKCLPAAIEVDGCLLFTSPSFCKVCEKNKRFDEDSGKCISFSEVSNCASHTFVTCDECLMGYVQERNSLYNSFESSAPSVNSVVFFNSNVSLEGNFADKSISNCVQPAFTNCSTFEMTDGKASGCATCLASHYLDPVSKSCMAYPAVVITNCKSYTNSLTCYRCNDGFWLDGNECKAVTTVPECLIYKRNSDGCETCNEARYLDPSGATACLARAVFPIPNCVTHSLLADECTTCADTFVASDERKACLEQILHCSVYEPSPGTPTALTCLTCNTHYYVVTDKKSCLVQKIPDCETHVTNMNECSDCYSGFYLSPTKTCLKKSLSGCAAYVTTFVNECLTCQNLFSLAGDNTCVALTDGNCARNTPNSTTCVSCKPGFYLDSGAACVASNKTIDPLCSEVTDDGKCVQCPHGYLPFQLNAYFETLPSNCVEGNLTTGFCMQCNQNMDSAADANNAGNMLCTSTTVTDSKCLQLKRTAVATLGDNDGDCALCRTPNTHFLTSNTCNERSIHTRHKCSSLSASSDVCETCDLDNHLSVLDEDTAYCMDPPSIWTLSTIAGCRIYDFFADGKCLMCENNFTLTPGTPDTCVAVSGDPPSDNEQFHIDMVDGMKVKKGNTNTGTMISECAEHYYNEDQMENRCSKCNDGFTSVIDHYFKSADKNKHFSPDPLNILISSNLNNATKCTALTDAEFMRYEAGSALSIAANCEAAYDYGSKMTPAQTGNYICLACKSGFVGTAKTIAFDKTGNPITTWTPSASALPNVGYAECVSTSEMTKVYKRLQYSNDVEGTSTTFNEILYDTCSDATKNVVHIRANDSFFFGLGVEGPSGTERPSSVCQVIPAVGKIDNCQVYTLENVATEPRDLALEETYLCMYCKPGYIFKAGAEGEECLPIQNCNLSSANTWLNGCETCDTGYAYPINTSSKLPNFTQCKMNSSSTETNCFLNRSDDGKCVLCKNNMTLNPTTKVCENFPTTCASNGYPNHDVTDFTSNDTLKNVYLSLFIRLYLDNYKLGPSMCSSCSSGKKMYMAKDATDAAKKVCYSNAIASNLVDGCLVSDASGVPGKCHECKSEYRLKDGACEIITNDEQSWLCSERNSGSTCLSCMDGYYLDASNDCVQNEHCLDSSASITSNGRCIECKQGYKLHSSDYRKCVPIESSSQCLSYYYDSSGRGFCTKCLNCQQTPVRFQLGTNESNVFCVNSQSSYSLTDYFLYYQKDSNLHKGELGNPHGTVPSGKFIKTVFGDNSPIAEYVCVRNNYDPNCTSFDSSNKYDCTSCKAGYYLNTTTRVCLKGMIPGCNTYTSETVCATCHTNAVEESQWRNYYKNGDNCSVHTSINCAIFSSSTNACTGCHNGYHLDSGLCKPNVLATNCQESVTNNDQCSSCSEKYYLTGTTCHLHTVKNCLDYNPSLDRCNTCKENFYMSSHNCLENTAPNCKTKSTTNNYCSECNLVTEYPNGEKGCEERETIANCTTYNTSSKYCSDCADGFFESGGMCEANPSGVTDCVAYSSATVCTTCANTHFLNGNQCDILTNTISSCAVYSADGVCLACDPLHLLKADGTACDSVTENSCATWTAVDNCATCSGNNVLKANTDSKMQCVASGIDHCISPVVGTPKNTCNACSDGFILRDGECFSPKISITNCRVYNVDTEVCMECYAGKVLSADQKECLSKISQAGDFCARGHIDSDTEPTCNLCKFGYSKNAEGICEACGGEGCFICDSADLTKCRVCASDYYMSASGSCSLNNPPEPESAVISRLISLVALLMLIWNKE